MSKKSGGTDDGGIVRSDSDMEKKRSSRSSMLRSQTTVDMSEPVASHEPDNHEEDEKEARHMARFSQFKHRPMTRGEKLNYLMENVSASQPNAYFYMLIGAVVIAVILLGALWMLASEDITFPYSAYLMFQLIAAGQLDDSLQEIGTIIVFLIGLLFGFIVFAVLVGMVTEAFTSMVQGFDSGRSQVPEKNHTLVLGWNETTPRIICQIAFLRRAWRQQNETFGRKWCPLCVRRVEPSSPVAKHKVVILCNTKTKAEMHELIMAHFVSRGISNRRTKVGWDVVCRVGDPTNAMDLRLVGAHRAMSIICQLTEEDEAEEARQDGCLQNGRTFKCLLALRHVLFTANVPPPWHNFRIVVQLHRPSEAIMAATWTLPDGRPAVLVQDLSIFLNNLLFSCIAYPGLGSVLNDILGFEGVALRLTAVSALDKSVVGKTVGELDFAFMDSVLAGVVPEGGMSDRKVDHWQGFACNARRRIDESDRLILIGSRSMPTMASGITAQPLTGYTPKHPESDIKNALRVLVCGWRSEWNKPRRLGRRLQSICEDLPANSSVTFMNMRKQQEFEEDMKKVMEVMKDLNGGKDLITSKKKGQYVYAGRTTFDHFEGDAAISEQLHALLIDKIFDVAIVMSTIAGKEMPAESRDTRAMAVMLFLRYYAKELERPPMRIIGENAIDSTEELALVPRGEEGGDPAMPDFVNMHTIYARALCQDLAFPRLQPATRQLFGNLPGGPQVAVRPAECFVRLGEDIKFATVKAQVRSLKKSDVCLGYRTHDGNIEMAPKLTDSHVYVQGDRIVIITRDCDDEDVREV